jgi:alpha/beta hydrolase fold
MSTRRAAALALLVLVPVAVAASGCGGRSTSAELRDRLLAVTDLPAGWAVTPTTGKGAAVKASCLSSLPRHPQSWSFDIGAFAQGTSVPNLVEVLATGSGVREAWKRLAAALARCHTSSLVLGTAKVEAQVQPVSLRAGARESAAYAWTFTLGGIRLGFDLVLFQAAAYSGYIAYADLAAPRKSTVTAFVRAAIAKAATRSTAPIPDTISIASTPVQTVHTSFGTVGYRSIGSGPPLVLITGYSGTMETWDRRFVDALARHHRIVIFDNAGIGKTAVLPSPLTIDGMANQTSALIAALGLKRVDVLGWSMGSMIAQALAILHPSQVRRLVLCAPIPAAARPSSRRARSWTRSRAASRRR